MVGKAGVKIGLALGGGAARGWAHIGVLKALEKAGINSTVLSDFEGKVLGEIEKAKVFIQVSTKG